MSRLTATEAARNFSALLNRVAEGEEIEIVRNGAVVALVAPPKGRLLSAARFRDLLESAPPVDDEFVADVRRSRAETGPPETSWPS